MNEIKNVFISNGRKKKFSVKLCVLCVSVLKKCKKIKIDNYFVPFSYKFRTFLCVCVVISKISFKFAS